MKEKIKNFVKKNKDLLLCVFLVGIMVFGLWAFAMCTDKRESVSVSADSVSTVAENTDNSMLYPSANLSKLEDFDVRFNWYYKDYGFNLVVKPNTTYTLSYDYIVYKAVTNGEQFPLCLDVGIGSTPLVMTKAVGFSFLSSYNNNYEYNVRYHQKITFTIPDITSTSYLLFRPVSCNGNQGDVFARVEKVQLNYGNVAYPYIPNFDGLYEDGYKQGELKAKAGYFADVEIHSTPTFSNGTLVTTEITTPTYVYGGVSFGYLYNHYKPLATEYGIDKINLNLVFDIVVPASSFRMKATGNETAFVNTFYVVADEGYMYLARFRYIDEEKAYCLEIKTDGAEISQITSLREIVITNIEDLKSLTFINSGSEYQSGYSVGYNEGLSDGKDTYSQAVYDAYTDGIIEGEKTGYKKGYDVGLAKGQSDDPYDLGDFFFSIVDAPFYVIRNALNFEILGVNIASLVLFILTALVVIFVIKKVKGG